MTSFRSGLLAIAFASLLPQLALAQGTTSSGSSSSSSRTTSSSGSTSTQSGSASSMSGSATGSSNAGGSGGSAAGGSGAAGGTLDQPDFAQFGQATTQQGFVGRGNNTQTFVGSANAGQQTVDAGGTARFSGLGGGGGGTGGGASTSQARGSQMRVPQRIAFSVPALPAPVLSASLQGHFTALQQRLPGVSVASGEAGHVVLSGVVDSDHARKLAEAIARLEPGVRKITNELRVGAASDALPRLP